LALFLLVLAPQPATMRRNGGHLVFTVVLAVQTSISVAECPNACSGHGSCGLFDSCTCFPNWFGGDCGERVCPFNRAFADSPKGDLDGSNTIDESTVIIGSDMYPLGTMEEFPDFVDVLGNTYAQTAHDYYECSNAGTCDRTTGTCVCFKGFEGSACQRTKCPANAMGECSGHGKCWSVSQMQEDDEVYELWDKEKLYGCHCDPSYFGADCLQRYCPMDVDPKYLQGKDQIIPTTQVSFAIYDKTCEAALDAELYPFLRRLSEDGADAADHPARAALRADYLRRGLLTESDLTADEAAAAALKAEYDALPDEASKATMRKLMQAAPTALPIPAPSAAPPAPAPSPLPTIARLHTEATLTGTFALKFYDVFGEDFSTKPIVLEDYTTSVGDGQTNTCSDIVNALEALPNTVVEHDTVHCQERNVGVGYGGQCGVTYSLTYTGNPGYLKDLEVDYYLDGQRATVFNHFGEAGVNVTTEVFTGNNVGAVDYWATKCEGVEITTNWLSDGELGVNKWGYLGSIDTGDEYSSLVRCLGDSNGIEIDNVEVYNWDYGSWSYPNPRGNADYAGDGTGPDSQTAYSSVMGGNPHIIRLVPKDYHDVHDETQLALVWVDQQVKPGTFGFRAWMASPPEDTTTTYIPYATDGTAELVYLDDDLDHELHATGGFEPRVTARFTRGSNLIYTSHDAACETASNIINPCLDKGDMIFLFDANWGRTHNTSVSDYGAKQRNYTMFGGKDFYTHRTASNGDGSFYADRNYNTNTGVPYTIKKIYKSKVTATTNMYKGPEDRYRIEVDKGINWGNALTMGGYDPDGDGVVNTGYVQIIKFSPATTGNYQFFDECSGRGICDRAEGLCNCVEGYVGLACEMFDTLNM
jgi:hypothetical protein